MPRWCLSEQAPTDLQIVVDPAERSGRRRFSVHARTGAGIRWVLQASGMLSAEQPVAGVVLAASLPAVQAIDPDSFYQRLAEQGYRYGGPFCSVRGIGTDPTDPGVVDAEVELPAGTDVSGYGIHPALLDAALHAWPG